MSSPFNTGPIPGFPGARVIGTLNDDLKAWQVDWLKKAQTLGPQPLDLSVHESPIMLCTKEVKAAYQNSNYDEIQRIENKAKDDLEPLDDNVRVHGPDAFVKVDYQGVIYYICYNQNASTWIYNYKSEGTTLVDGKGTAFNNYYQVGKYTVNSGLAATSSMVFKITDSIISGILASLVGKFIQTVLKEGTTLVIRALIPALASFAEEMGLTIIITITGTSALVGCIVFVLVFIGIMFFWDWLNRKYTIELRIYNWSTDHALSVSQCYCDNANMICEEQNHEKACEIVIPKMIPKGSEIAPPGFNPPVSLDNICNYVTYIFNNDSTFLRGCGIGLKLEVDQKDSGKGFTYAFDCPRFQDNRQKAKPGVYDPKEYFNEAGWQGNPLSFSIKTSDDQIPVSFSLDALSDNDSTYRPIVNFNK